MLCEKRRYVHSALDVLVRVERRNTGGGSVRASFASPAPQGWSPYHGDDEELPSLHLVRSPRGLGPWSHVDGPCGGWALIGTRRTAVLTAQKWRSVHLQCSGCSGTQVETIPADDRCYRALRCRDVYESVAETGTGLEGALDG